MEIAAAPKSQRVRAMRQAAARTGRGFGTVRRKFYEYERDGDAALVDRRRVKATAAANPWAECYMTYVERDRNTSMGGYRQMMGDFRAGRPMVGAIGTWVDVFRREFPGVPVPASCPADWTPRGATYANLQEAAKRSVKDALPLLGEAETKVAYDALGDLRALLRRHLDEFGG